MNTSQFKSFLARIKQDFECKLRTRNSKNLTIEEVAQLLHRHMNGEPFAQRQLLLKSTGHQHLLTWDDLLAYLQEDLSLQQTVKKIELSPISSTEIIDTQDSTFDRLIQYVKHKETNAIQSIFPVTPEVGQNMFLVSFEHKIIIYDVNNCELVGHLDFKYQHGKRKMLEETQLLKSKSNEQDNLEISDKVEPIPRKKYFQKHSRLSHNSINFLTNNIKSSVRGSSISSEISNDRIIFRRFNTESADNRLKIKSNLLKIKNDDVHHVFELFQRASVDNSIAIAHAFTQARTNLQKCIVIDKKVLQKQKKEEIFQLSTAHVQKSFARELNLMRRTSKQLDRTALNSSIEIAFADEGSAMKSGYHKQRSASKKYSTPLFRSDEKQQGLSNALAMGKKTLQIVHYNTFQNLLLVSLYNREVRLLELKHTLNRLTEDTVFTRSFHQIVSFVQIYRSQKSGILQIVLALEKPNYTQMVIYALDKQMQPKNRKYGQRLSFVAKCQGVLPLGVVLFNELGNFSLLQLNNPLTNSQEQIQLTTQLFDTVSGYRISINQVRSHRNMAQFYLGCSHGYVYQYDMFSKTVKYQTQVSHEAVLDLCLIREDRELVSLLGNGNIIILSSLHLEQIYIYQSYHFIPPQSRLLFIQGEKFYVYNMRAISSYKLSLNEQKAFSNTKPLKILKSRLLLRHREANEHQHKKGKVLKIVVGNGGNTDFLALLLEHGQVIIFGPEFNYIGSYHVLRVENIVDLACNNYYQFISILFQDNTLQIINLYTQNTIFQINNGGEALSHNKKYSASSALQKFCRVKHPQKGAVRMVHFFEAESSQSFLAVINKDNIIYHYCPKGTVQLKVNLSQRCGDDATRGPMLFNGEELALGHDGDVIMLHRKSYLRKYVIKVGDCKIVHLKRSKSNQQILCGVDSLNRLFVVDLPLRRSRYLKLQGDIFKYDTVLFTEFVLVKYNEGVCLVTKDNKEISVEIDNKKYCLAAIGNEIVRVSKQSGLLARFDFVTNKFEDLKI